MKYLITILLLYCTNVSATNYYFSANGNDASSGRTPLTAWQSISKFNSFFSSLQPGDSVLFNRGDVFIGEINISRSGTATASIVIGAYGTGAKPIITGLQSVTGWTGSGNIWTSTNTFNTSNPTIAFVNGFNVPMGRYPNKDYNTIDSHDGNFSITDNDLPSSPNWTGAELVIRRDHWTIDRSTITGQSGTIIKYVATGYDAIDGFGYFIQNDIKTLDVENEWYFNSSKRLQMFAFSMPTNVQLCVAYNLINASNKSYVVFDNIYFLAANFNVFDISGSNFTIKNCEIGYAGNDGIQAGSSNNVTIQNNIIKNSGFIAGSGGNSAKDYIGIHAIGSNVLIEYNQVLNSGYNGIEFNGQGTIIRNNFINYSCVVKDDGAGIYAWNDGSNPTNYTGRKVLNNIILNAIGAPQGAKGENLGMCLYFDDNTANVEASGNTMAHAGYIGAYMHNTHDVQFTNNTIYNCPQQLSVTQDNIPTNPSPIFNMTITGNILFSKDARQWTAEYANRSGVNTGVKNFGTYDNNYYARPINDNATISVGAAWTSYTLSGWKSFSGKDVNSKGSPKTITSTNDLFFDYNYSSNPTVVPLPGNYIDVKNVLYSGTVTIQPYGSVVLIKTIGTPPPIPVCTYTYSAWGVCTNGMQTRTVLSSSPAGCSGLPVLSQSCTIVPPVIKNDTIIASAILYGSNLTRKTVPYIVKKSDGFYYDNGGTKREVYLYKALNSKWFYLSSTDGKWYQLF